MDDNKPRLIGRKEAAAYCGISPAAFSMWVSSHKMPPAIPGTRMWDKRAIDARLDEISGLISAEKEDPYDKWIKGDQASQPAARSSSNYNDWREAKLKRREKYRPQLGLDTKLEQILRHMAEHPECDTIDVIPGAGPVLLEKLVTVGAVEIIHRGDPPRYGVSDIGRDELHRLKKWKSLTP